MSEMTTGGSIKKLHNGDDPQLDSVGKHSDTERSSPTPF